LKNSQLTSGKIPRISGTGHWHHRENSGVKKQVSQKASHFLLGQNGPMQRRIPDLVGGMVGDRKELVVGPQHGGVVP